MAGRPTELTDDVIRKIEEVAALDGTVEEMAFYADVHRATIYRWLKEDTEFSDRIDALKQRPFLKARQTIVKSLDEPQHAFEYMKRKKKDEFSERVDSKTDITTNGESLNIITDRELDYIANKLEEYDNQGENIISDGKDTNPVGEETQN